MQYLIRHWSAARLSLGCFFILFSLVDAHAAPSDTAKDDAALEAAVKAVENKEYSEAYAVFSRLAEAGNAEAQHNLALLLRTGKGVEKDLKSSLKWFKRAAEQDISDAQYYLGYMYDNGEAVERDPKKAFEWYQKAAERGQGMAQINLGVIYANGHGVPQDISQAYLWFHVAAAQGYKVAFENRLVIETALKEQGELGAARLEHLKKQARGYFQQYVQPFAPKAAPYRGSMAPPPKH